MTMQFPSRTTDPDSPSFVDNSQQRRDVWQMLNGEAIPYDAGSGDVIAPTYANQEQVDLNCQIQWYEGRSLQRKGKEETQRLIGVVERRLTQNAKLLEQLPPLIESQQHVVEGNADAVEQARQRAMQVQVEDRAQAERRMRWQPGPTGIIFAYPDAQVFDGDCWLTIRGCQLRDTPEYRRYKLLEARVRDASTPEAQAMQELQRLRLTLADEKKLTPRLLGRLDALQRNLAWWNNELAQIDAPPPSAIPSNPALRAHLLALKKAGQLPGELAFSE